MITIDKKDAVSSAALDFLTKRQAALHGVTMKLKPETDVFALGLLDSLALTELVLHVERETGREIDFLMIDPGALNSIAEIVDAFTNALSDS